MEKMNKVEQAFKNGDQLVFYDSPNDTIYVCFGKIKIKGHEITFYDCSIADVNDFDEYYGDVFNESYNITFRLDHPISKYLIPTLFYKQELIEKRIRRRH